MKKIVLSLIGLLSVYTSIAQTSEVEDKLKIMYADEKYPKCADKAIGYTEGKYKKDPVPYIYVSMACLRMSQDNKYATEFPKAFKDALSYAGKYGKKDPEGLYYNQYINHFEELKKIVAEEIENFLLEDDKAKKDKAIKNALGLLKSINDMDFNDKGAMLLRGSLELQAQNSTVGKPLINTYLPMLKELKATKAEMPSVARDVEEEEGKKKKSKGPEVKPLKAFEDMTEMEQRFIKLALINYAEYLDSKNNNAEAKEVIAIGKPFFYSENDLYLGTYNDKYKVAYNTINK